ncbi:hypothetical protein BC831DRAFT_451657 [Entophlyctis helioformis]|nr:hypothetical protein BC831DRAFT_451657 [Entophlyctis helioformis]
MLHSRQSLPSLAGQVLLLATALFAAFGAVAQAASLQFRLDQLNAVKDRSRPISLDSDSFRLYTESPRNYSLFVLLTTSSAEHNCHPCREFAPEYRLATEAWARSFVPGKAYFAELDYLRGADVFSQLAVRSVPLMLRFPPTEGEKAIRGDYETFDFNRNGLTAEPFAQYVESTTGIRLNIRRPVDHTNTFIAVGFGAVALLVVAIFRAQILSFVQSKQIWISFTMFLTTLMCAGYMWNTIRTPPYIGSNNGQAHFMSGGTQYQFGVETHIIGFLYGVSSLTFILMVTYIPTISSPEKQRTSLYMLLMGHILLYSVILSYFRMKSGNYPFKLLL